MHDFDQIIDRRYTASAKWQKYPEDILPFWVADMDFRAPDVVLNALHKRVDHGIFGYTIPPATLVNGFIRWLEKQYSWQVSEEWLVWVPGVVPGFNLACRAVGQAGDSVMMSVPVYYPFLSAPKFQQREAIYVPLTLDTDRNTWVMNINEFQRAVQKNTRMFLFCNPHNPTGRVYSETELRAFADFCLEQGLLICSDEIHCPLVLDSDKRHIPVASLGDDIAQRSISLFAPTKTYNTPGLGCSVAVIPDPEVRRNFRRAQAGLVPGIGPLEYAAADAAYNDTGSWVSDLTRYLSDNAIHLENAVADTEGISMTHVEATYLAWIDCSDLGIEKPAEYFEPFGLGLSEGAQFQGPGFIRFNFGCPRSMLDEGISRLKRGIEAL